MSQQEQAKETAYGVVKHVPSGDTIQIIQTSGPKRNGPPREREITLSNCNAPRLARRSGGDDEEFAWAAREFLRTLVVGKQVRFTIEHSTKTTSADGKSTSGREYGYVHLRPTPEEPNGVDVAQEIVRAGWVRVREPPQGREPREDAAELLRLQQEAVESKRGIHTEDASVRKHAIRKIQYLAPLEQYSRLRNKTVAGVVEYFVNASLVRITTVPSFHSLMVNLAGIQVPIFRRQADGQIAAEPFAAEAKFVSERLLLSHTVDVTILTTDKKENLYAQVLWEGRDISEQLLKNGLAWYIDWSCPAEKKPIYQSCQALAQSQRKGLWSRDPAHWPRSTAPPSGPSSELVGKVREVQNNGSILIVDTSVKPPMQKLLNLSSLTIPRLGGNTRPDDDWAWEAHELLRTRLVGHQVRAKVDYKRPPYKPASSNETLPEREFHSVFLEGRSSTNVAMLLVERGYATLVNHRQDDPRASDYEVLVDAELKAKKLKRGVHSDKDAPKHKALDLSQSKNAAQAKSRLAQLQRNGRMKAVVEYVVHGGRFKLFVPKENVRIMFSLTGIRTPSGRAPTPEPFAEESVEFARDVLHQHNVEIEVEAMDKGGSFLGYLHIQNQNFALTIVSAGLARLHTLSAERSPIYGALVEMENAAKRDRRNIWKSYDEAKEREKREAAIAARNAASTSDRKELRPVEVTDIVSGSRLFVQYQGDNIEQLNSVMKDLQTYCNATSPDVREVKRGELVAARFAADRQWYRARALAHDSNNEVRLVFIDYGNTDVVKIGEIRALPEQFAELPAQAHECQLAYIRVPSLEDEYGHEAALFLAEMASGQRFLMNTEYREDNVLYVTLADKEKELHVNGEMVANGFARVERRHEPHLKALVAKLKEKQDAAKSARRNMWEYGDPGNVDERDVY